MFITLIVILGVIIYYFEHKNRANYEKVFEQFFIKTDQNPKLTDSQKIAIVQQMLQRNGYKTEKKQSLLIGRKKLFSLGLLLATLCLYLIYYFYLQKPHTLSFSPGSISSEQSASAIT